jgi:IrrE N-terminal-like domain
MVQPVQQIIVGTSQSLHWQCDLLPATAQHAPELCWASLTLQVRGQILWQITAWPLVDMLHGLARIWPWLMLEEGYPIDISPEHIGKMMNAAEHRWADLPAHQAEAEEDALFDFRQRHDLSLLLRGLNVAPLCLLLEGKNCQIWSPALTSTVDLRHVEVMASLEQLGNALAKHIASQRERADCHPRAITALDRWHQREANTYRLYLPIVTGFSHAEIEALQKIAGTESPVMREFLESRSAAANEDTLAQANELQMAARMSREVLDTKAQCVLLQKIQALPLFNTAQLDQLCQKRPPLDESLAPYEQGYQLANWVRKHQGCNSDAPFHPDHLLQQLDLAPQTIDLDGPVDAVAVWGPRHGPAILLNQNTLSRASSTNGRRTTLAHEICHLLVDRENALPVAEVLGGQVARRAEQRANAFAAELLLPRSVAASVCREHSSLLEAAEYLNTHFMVSREVVTHQILNSETGMSLSQAERRALDQWRNPQRHT